MNIWLAILQTKKGKVVITVSFKLGQLIALRAILLGSIIIEAHCCLCIERPEIIVEQHLSRRSRHFVAGRGAELRSRKWPVLCAMKSKY